MMRAEQCGDHKSQDYPESMDPELIQAPPPELSKYLDLLRVNPSSILPVKREAEHYGKVFNDPVHGHITLHPLLVRIIDTPEFQRLRYIKALGLTYYVYYGATHCRFEHSIGVAYLAGELILALAARQPELQVSRGETLCVMIAGLLHDLGHGPFSHTWERIMHAINPNVHWEHEQTSIDMIDHLLAVNNLQPIFSEFGLQEQDLVLIKEMIFGPQGADGKYISRPPRRQFLFEIVANKRNGVDVDKWDYLSRDSRQVSMEGRFDCSRFINFSAVTTGDNGVREISFRDKEVDNLYDMFRVRFSMHKRVYQHRVVRIIETMMIDAIKKADPFMTVPGKDGKLFHYSEAYQDMMAFSRLDDSISRQIEMDMRPELEPARHILSRIARRDLYSIIGRALIPESSFEIREEKLVRELILAFQKTKGMKINEDYFAQQIGIIKCFFDYGMKGRNPVKQVTFFDKNQPFSRFIEKEDVSNLLPERYRDVIVLFYFESNKTEEIEQAASVVEVWARDNNINLQNSSVQMSAVKAKRPYPDDEPSSKPKRNLQAQFESEE